MSAAASSSRWRTSRPDPSAYYFLAQTHYALKDYEAGIENVETAIRVAEESDIPVKENWVRLLEYMRWNTDAGAD